MQFLGWLLLVPLGVYAAVAAQLYFTQSDQLFFPEPLLIATPDDAGLPYEDVRLTSDDGTRLHAWFIGAAASPRATVLYLHGNAGNLSYHLGHMQQLTRLGLNVFAIDYRGYGQSDGKPSEAGMMADAVAAWRYLAEERDISPRSIIIVGRSLGGPVAAGLAVRHTPVALVVESSFTSVPELAAVHYPWLPVRWLSRFEFPTRRYLGEIACPVLIVHARDDEIAPYAQGEALFVAAREPKEMLSLAGGHNDAQQNDETRYLAGLDAFLSEHIRAE